MSTLARLLLKQAIFFSFFLAVSVLSSSFSIQGGALVGYSYKTIIVNDWYQCLDECLYDNQCSSYNFDMRSSRRHACELNSCAFKSQCDAEEVLIKDPWFVFHQLRYKENGTICEGKKKAHPPKEPHKKEIELAVSCSERMKLYIDGNLVQPGNFLCALNTTYIFVLITKPRLIALEGSDNSRGQPGLVASLGDEIYTDSSWKCSTTPEQGWEGISFDDSQWSNAVAFCNNSAPVWPIQQASRVSDKAEWIWSDQPSVNRQVYCRKTFNDSLPLSLP